jgi:hypothetical protein
MELKKEGLIAAYSAELHKQQPLPSMPSSITNCKRWFSMLRKEYAIEPANIALFASKKDFDEIASLKLLDKDSEDHRQKMELPCGDVTTGEGGVNEDEIPIMKALFNFMSRRLDP